MERKLATVLFVDLVDSTSLVSTADPEVVRRRVSAYFEQVSRCIVQYGGTVEKFAGDAVMAAFGVPVSHEDDAERALRAAFAVMDVVHGEGLEARVGVESGEVVVESAESTFATGEAVNVAARLQQGAAPGEIRIGPGTRRLAAGAVEVEDAGALELRGRPDPVWTWRVLRIVDHKRRRPRAPFVGREDELELMHNTLARAVRGRRAQLLTVFGDAGVGKTRLTSEFREAVERATVLSGRALPYGEGVTYWPLASMIKASAGIRDDDQANEAFEKLRVCCESDAVADLLALALGVLGAAEAEHSSEELSWAAVRWAKQLGDAQPLVLVFEDLHWADERLLDLIEHLAASLRDVPILIVCVARPELLECRPTWGGGNPRAVAIELGALDERESEELAASLLDEEDVPPAQRARLLEKAEGNPLFLEETARMLSEGNGDGSALERIPDTLQALIASRIDRLDPDQKLLLQRGALVGRVFWRGAIDYLSPDLEVSTLLDALLEREFVAPEEHSRIAHDRAFQFTHGLIREVAYASTSKAQRAEDHRRFADWLDVSAGDEMTEIRAYHLDHAATLMAELEGSLPADLAAEAADALEHAGARSLRREAFAIARRFLLRANELEPSLMRRFLAARAAMRMAEFDVAQTELSVVRADAHEAGDARVEGRALLGLAYIQLNREADVPKARQLAEEAVRILDPEDDKGQYDANLMLARIGWWRGDLAEVEEHANATLELARRLGRKEFESRSLSDLAHVRAEEDRAAAHELFDQALELADESESLESRANVLVRRAQLELEERNFDDARASIDEAVSHFREIGSMDQVGWALATEGEVALEAGDVDAAEGSLREAVRVLAPLRQRGNLVEAQRQLGDVMLARGRIGDAERYALAAKEIVGGEDAWSRALTLSTLGLVRAAQGHETDAKTLLDEAVAIGDSTGYKGLKRRLSDRVDAFERGRSVPAS